MNTIPFPGDNRPQLYTLFVCAWYIYKYYVISIAFLHCFLGQHLAARYF